MKIKLMKINVLFVMFVTILIALSSCEKSDTPSSGEKRWLTTYRNVTIGCQENTTYGHFFKPKDGTTVKLNDVTEDVQKYCAMLMFREYGDALIFSFPANAEASATFGVDDISLFTQNPQGLKYWKQSNMNNGLIREKLGSLTAVDFNLLANSANAIDFDKVFKENNFQQEEFITIHPYDFNPKAGDIYLVQYNGLIRGLLLVKNIVGTSKGSITFDLIIESRSTYRNLENTKYLQPELPAGK